MSDLEERFWNKTMTIPETGCIWWVGSTNTQGYGRINVNGKTTAAHRLSYELHNGAIPSGLWVLHACDNPSCVNIEHLFLGTHRDNVDDMVRKGRSPSGYFKGEKHPQAKITNEQAREIAGLDGLHTDIAKAYGISFQTVYDIKIGRRWSSATGIAYTPPLPQEPGNG